MREAISGDFTSMMPPRYVPLRFETPDTTLPALATPTDDRPHLTATPVCTEAEALAMGFIRDARRDGFSRDTTAIDHSRQLRWWRKNRHRVKGWLYRDSAGALVGYGLVRQEADGRWWSSCATLQGFEGRGYGGAILGHVIASVPHEVYAAARNDNDAALRLHNRREWDVLGADERSCYFRTKPKIRTAIPSLSLADYEGWGGQ